MPARAGRALARGRRRGQPARGRGGSVARRLHPRRPAVRRPVRRRPTVTELTPATRRVGAIDCGTNSLRLLVADLTSTVHGVTMVDVHRELRVVRLGEGVDRTGRLSPGALDRAWAALADYTAILRASGVGAVRMAATSATRDAANRGEFESLVQRVLGQPAEIITGREEAELSFRGAVAELDPAARPVPGRGHRRRFDGTGRRHRPIASDAGKRRGHRRRRGQRGHRLGADHRTAVAGRPAPAGGDHRRAPVRDRDPAAGGARGARRTGADRGHGRGYAHHHRGERAPDDRLRPRQTAPERTGFRRDGASRHVPAGRDPGASGDAALHAPGSG